MLTWLLLPSALAATTPAPSGCTEAKIRDVAAIPAPAVIVLGERKGTQPDLQRAERIVGKLYRLGKVTLALESVHRDAQPVLDRFAAGELPEGDLPALLGWEAYWGFPWTAYDGLVGAASWGVEVLGVGLTLGPKPDDAQMPIPPGYTHVLADAMGDHPMPVELESEFVQTVAWRDHQIAKQAIAGWDGTGWLVILADRFHVEGGLGVGWQAQRLTEAPVHTFLLADGDGRCYPGDRVLTGLLPF